ncbi:MBL fold metallo-hydrolase [Catellatospora sp. NPDC049133]|uniref:MBL fold metallo-hydrolase n=1 Tax=Catellatospora sp. NPDC049133 TaxID=3155499 RepID=UPI0033F6DFD7
MASQIPYVEAGLHRLGPETYTYLQPSGSWGLSNCGVIASDGAALLVDTLFTLPLTQRMLAAVAAQLPAARISTVVNTHANGDHCWGNQLLPGAEIISSQATHDGMEREIPPAAMAAMTRDTEPDSPMGAYMRQFFGDFDFSGIQLTKATRTFSGTTRLSVGAREVELIEVGPAHTDGDVIVHVPDSGIVYAGDILFIGDHPVIWEEGSVDGWIAACDRILATGADTIVPGHGPVTDAEGVRDFREYLEYVSAFARRQFSRGTPYWVAAAGMDIELTDFAAWGHPERLVVTIGSIYQSLGATVEGGRAEMLDRMVRLHQERTKP